MNDYPAELACRATIFDEDDCADRRVLAEYHADRQIEVIDRWEEQVANVRRLRPAPDPQLLAESKRWAFYPWRSTLVSILGPRGFRALRLDRNRNLITAAEQDRLARLQVGVVGLSVGHAIAYMLAAEGLCGGIRLADFDILELSNLNRVPATVLDLGLNKAIVAARRIAELDPYLPVVVETSGLCADTIDGFLDGLDVVVEECDSLDMKARVRTAARAYRIPVLMATGDRGLVDVERYDLEPSRHILHGLLGDIDVTELSGLSSRAKVPHVLRVLDAARLSARSAASMVEIDETLATWPQLAGEVALGATAVAEAVRRIGLGETLRSGRVRIDVAEALDHLAEPDVQADGCRVAEQCAEHVESPASSDLSGIVAAAASRAPSGGNSQPWLIETEMDSVTIRLAGERTATMDVDFRASAVAVGAAWFNARVAAARYGMLGPVELREPDDSSPLAAVVRLTGGSDHDLACLYRPMLQRESNRHLGVPLPLDVERAAALSAAAAAEGARLQLLTEKDDIEQIAAIVAAADRIRYLTPSLHADMLSEIRWYENESSDSGIDVRSLEMDQSELAGIQIAKRPDVMKLLAGWGAGSALGNYSRDRLCASSGVGVVSISGHSLRDYARGGAALEAVWITAQQLGLGVHPMSPVFLFARTDDELQRLSPTFAAPLRQLQRDFRDVTHTKPDDVHVLMLRFSYAPRASVRSRRRTCTAIVSNW
ncbi:Rv1355c family protein [Mycobacterium riyadhense]|uniref:THIF-type NAD/FAD binding fold domain-containing protein n=2 Tax=Mycobacterium riyadhense TaxID=486698 RepID=A0A1X2D7F4_9MYCO|nr:Rv1355c family protein [Mycobacterium riyadhense]MCV7146126.1 Rv1355c family protein [Mycobacterium riyadhense]ORW84092.1 hypothetical protein AWC22_13965 [Mycobacterium riyadhense]